ncbi:MAG: hypothetical protein KY432_08315, partial [Acidobacteria bacterium]|nr:hypothetical protein [Acidobacteriota bacterium]
MSPNRTRFFSAVVLMALFTIFAVVAVRSGASTPRAVFMMGGVFLLAIVLYDLIVARSYGRRLRWIDRVSDELRSIAKREKDRLSPSPVSDLDPLREKLSQVADALLRQTSDLERQKQVLGEILNGMGEGLLAIDESKRIVLANDRIGELFGGNRPTPGRLFYEVLRHASLVSAFDHGLAGEAFRERAPVT